MQYVLHFVVCCAFDKLGSAVLVARASALIE